MILVGELEGSITGEEEIKVALSSLKLNNHGENSITFSMDNVDLTANQDGVFIEQFSGTIGNAPINGIISYLDSQSKFIGSININEFYISEDLFSRTPLKGKFSKLSGKVDFESVKGNINGNLSISNKLGLGMSGDINIINKDSNVLLRSLNLYSEDLIDVLFRIC